ncbi:unnamed protein product [Nyctereutes procyonoides]|uniref:(raccoon dog) hypothetical protein n=1 Tax=Nyctereutes procyonoides TaxID=34880 RepID=A0A811XWB8_NYCPR|nr:unnamed protein product [Nyctereutes procyonoides]
MGEGTSPPQAGYAASPISPPKKQSPRPALTGTSGAPGAGRSSLQHEGSCSPAPAELGGEGGECGEQSRTPQLRAEAGLVVSLGDSREPAPEGRRRGEEVPAGPAAPPEPAETRLQRKALTHQPGFIRSLPGCARGARETRKRTYLAALRGAPEATPRPAGRPAARPSLPGRARSPGSPAGRGAARPAAGPGSRAPPPARAHPPRPGPRVRTSPAELRSRPRSPRGRRGGGGGRGPGRSPGAGGVLGGGAGSPRPAAAALPRAPPRPRAEPSRRPAPARRRRPITARRRRSLCLGRGLGPMAARGHAGGARLGQWAARTGRGGRSLGPGRCAAGRRRAARGGARGSRSRLCRGRARRDPRVSPGGGGGATGP